MTREELIAALEAATGPGPELEAAIAKAMGWGTYAGKEVWWPPEETAKARRQKRSLWSCEIGPWPLPNFTFSIDAALTLVPEGSEWTRHRGVNGKMTMQVDGPSHFAAHGQGATPALALCIAAIKARGELV